MDQLGSRAFAVYTVYGSRALAFAPALQLLPPDAAVLGLITSDDPETSLWRPFGARRILHVLPRESAAEIRRRGIKYLLVKEELLGEPLKEWLNQSDGRLLGTVALRLRAGHPASVWHLVEMNTEAERPPDSAPQKLQ